MALHGTDVTGRIHIVEFKLEFKLRKALQMQGFYAIMIKSQKSRICLPKRVPELYVRRYSGWFQGLTHMRKQKTKWRKET